MSFSKKKLRIKESDVEVSCEKVAGIQCPTCRAVAGKSHCHSYRFTAQIGETTFHHTMTVGPVDGEVVVPTKEQLQKDVDAARSYAAKHAHFHEQVGRLESDID